MVKKVSVRQTGTSVSATIPKEMADRLVAYKKKLAEKVEAAAAKLAQA